MTRQPTPDIMADVLTSTPARRLPGHLLRMDGGTQPRDQISDDLVIEYRDAMKEGAQFPPVIAFFDGSDYWLADGFHRVHAAKAAGLDVLADVRQGTRRDAVLFSAGANATHGQRRTNADKRRAVLALLHDDEWRQWSDNEIARRCIVSQPFVGKIRSELTYNDYKSTERRGADGRTIDTANIGKRPQAPAPAPQAPSYVSQVDLQLAIGDWLDAFDDPEATLNELARDGQASILWEDLTASVPPCRPADLQIAIAAFRQRMASTRKQLATPDRPPAARQPAAIVQPPPKGEQPAISQANAHRLDLTWTFKIELRTAWTRCTPDQQRRILLQSAAHLEAWADQMREEAADL